MPPKKGIGSRPRRSRTVPPRSLHVIALRVGIYRYQYIHEPQPTSGVLFAKAGRGPDPNCEHIFPWISQSVLYITMATPTTNQLYLALSLISPSLGIHTYAHHSQPLGGSDTTHRHTHTTHTPTSKQTSDLICVRLPSAHFGPATIQLN